MAFHSLRHLHRQVKGQGLDLGEIKIKAFRPLDFEREGALSMDAPALIRTVADLRTQVAHWRREGKRIALVPTMGALHEGHLSLIRLGLVHADKVVVSIFVNPKQFNQASDLERYPRQEQRDLALIAEAGGHAIFAPKVAEIYPEGFATTVQVAGPTGGLCGAARPGHFDGVATVVTKLLLQCMADVAIFGEKDYQQLLTIKRLAKDLDIPVTILGAPLIRDEDGLALSSRNAHLSKREHDIALALPKALNDAKAAILSGEDVASALTQASSALLHAGFAQVDYFELRGAEDLTPLTTLDRPARLLAAGVVGETRLIDNIEITP